MRKEQVKEELYYLTEKISTLVRTTAIGLIAIIWGLLATDSASLPSFVLSGKNQLLWIGLFSIATMFFDFIQYFTGFWFMNDYRRILVKEKIDEISIDTSTFRYKLRGFLFWAKQVTLIIAVSWFIIFMLSALI